MSDEWFDNDEFWRIFGDCMFRPDRFEAAHTEAEKVLALTGVQTGAVLDLGCGPGRHAVPLALRGLEVTGLDLSEYLLEQAEEYAGDEQVEVEWVREDMREFSRPGEYDLILSMWTSFGYFEDPDDDLGVLESCYQNLSEGGAMLLDVAGKEIIVRDLQPVHLTEYDDGALLIERPLLQANMTRYSNEWILVRDDQAWRAEWHHNVYSGRELEDLLLEAGFDEVAVYGSLDGDDYDLDCDRLVVVAWK